MLEVGGILLAVLSIFVSVVTASPPHRQPLIAVFPTLQAASFFTYHQTLS